MLFPSGRRGEDFSVSEREKFLPSYYKILKCIDSCITVDQVNVCETMIALFMKNHGFFNTYRDALFISMDQKYKSIIKKENQNEEKESALMEIRIKKEIFNLKK